MNVDERFPYTSSITDEIRRTMSMPVKLCGVEDRKLAQGMLDAWLAAFPNWERDQQEARDPWDK
jgi:hypothetical protein